WPGLELFKGDVYYLDRIPVFVDTTTIALIVVMTLAVSFVFSIYPALRAAKADPIDAIRE
ncbi:MAG: lipoprotein-releasing system transmembrane subunit LolC, partial [Planctomycetota bacterium]|nr:lipoprotein-releasing system transmembrane subunit LolC [Planctomycetota bacterium]